VTERERQILETLLETDDTSTPQAGGEPKTAQRRSAEERDAVLVPQRKAAEGRGSDPGQWGQREKESSSSLDKTAPHDGVAESVKATLTSLREAQLEDEYCGPIMRYLQDPIGTAKSTTNGTRTEAVRCLLLEGKLLRAAQYQSKVIVPASLRQQIMQNYHDGTLGGHGGAITTYHRIKQDFWWPKMWANIRSFTRTCKPCQLFKIGQSFHQNKGKIGADASYPFHTVNVDIKGPLKVSASPRRNKYIVSVYCTMTHYVEAYAVPDKTSKTVAECLLDVISRHGVPRRVISDRGMEFMGGVTKDLLTRLKIEHSDGPAYAHWMSGLVERFHRSLGTLIQMYVANYKEEWDTMLPFALFAYRTAFQEKMRSTPFRLLYGRDPESITTLQVGVPSKRKAHQREGAELHERLVEAQEISAIRSRGKLNTVARIPRIIVGDSIRIKASVRGKMEPRYSEWKATVESIAEDGIYYIDHRNKRRKALRSDVKLIEEDREKWHAIPDGSELEQDDTPANLLQADGASEESTSQHGSWTRADQVI